MLNVLLVVSCSGGVRAEAGRGEAGEVWTCCVGRIDGARGSRILNPRPFSHLS